MIIPIRMISIATTIFWLILIGFYASAVYSVKDIHFGFEDPQVGMASENNMLISLSINVDNKGYYNIGSFQTSTKIHDKEGFMITQGSTLIPVIEKGRQVTAFHNVTVNVSDLMQNNQEYLFNDAELKVHEIVGMELAEIIPVQASTNFSVPWGAPLYNFTLDEIKYEAHNLTHTTANFSLSFENHAFFSLDGSIQIYLYSSTNVLISEGQTTIEASQQTPCQKCVELIVPTAGITEDGHVEVFLSTIFLKIGPLVFPFD